MAALYRNSKECCGCGMCESACPKGAISMVEDSAGFLYPHINKDLCVSCDICINVCAFRKESGPCDPLGVYALTRKNLDLRKVSSSGGAFSALAEKVLEEGGVVFGAALHFENNVLVPRHCMVSNSQDISQLRGSKYVQSSLGDTLHQAKQQLETGREVLYSGTPCQIAALKSFLIRAYDNLITVDLICHGVPNAKMFQDYIRLLEKKAKGHITEFYFRDKTRDSKTGSNWGENARAVWVDAAGKRKEMYIERYRSSYYELFLNSLISRDSCHNCPYAGKQHPADLTIGDFWGFSELYPEHLDSKLGQEAGSGVSVLLVNTPKGAEIWEKYSGEFHWMPSDFVKASKHNPQLCYPSKPGQLREQLLTLYRSKGYGAIEAGYRKQKMKNVLTDKTMYIISRCVPRPVRTLGKRLLYRHRAGNEKSEK